MHIEVVVEINAPAERVWAVMTDVERWPEWTASVTAAEVRTEGPLTLHSKVRLTQPKAPPVVWTVTEFEAGRFFRWETMSPVLQSSATHRLEPVGQRSRVTLAVVQQGIFASLFGGWVRRLSERYVRMEADGLKKRSEEPVTQTAE